MKFILAKCRNVNRHWYVGGKIPLTRRSRVERVRELRERNAQADRLRATGTCDVKMSIKFTRVPARRSNLKYESEILCLSVPVYVPQERINVYDSRGWKGDHTSVKDGRIGDSGRNLLWRVAQEKPYPTAAEPTLPRM